MKDFVYFVVGAVVGAAVALLFAPAKGEELRSHIQERALQDMERLQRTLDQDMQQINNQLARMQSQMQKLQEQLRGKKLASVVGEENAAAEVSEEAVASAESA
ncbi:MAG: hypothetical protein GXP42_04540 [Chloroflexi bacterium]|nr:hypothetical protein [Chloroflexota bacterium]